MHAVHALASCPIQFNSIQFNRPNRETRQTGQARGEGQGARRRSAARGHTGDPHLLQKYVTKDTTRSRAARAGQTFREGSRYLGALKCLTDLPGAMRGPFSPFPLFPCARLHPPLRGLHGLAGPRCSPGLVGASRHIPPVGEQTHPAGWRAWLPPPSSPPVPGVEPPFRPPRLQP